MGGLYAQSFPNWFYKPGNIPVNSYCGIVETDYHPESSFKAAFTKACIKAALYSGLKIKINQSFISAVDKNYWTNFDKEVQYDTSLVSYFENNYSVVDSFQTDKLTVVLISNSKYSLDTNLTSLSANTSVTPIWINSIPKSDQYYYAFGQAIQYYHDVSSWEEAENSAIVELAKEKIIKINSELTKEKSNYSDSIVDFQKEEVETTLRKIEIIERWIDKENKIFNVLARMPKN